MLHRTSQANRRISMTDSLSVIEIRLFVSGIGQENILHVSLSLRRTSAPYMIEIVTFDARIIPAMLESSPA
jgi:hypothetical protein